MKRIALAFVALSSAAFGQTEAHSAAQRANAYAFDTFQLFRQLTDGNFCYSPYSSQRIAALLVEGARGDTAKELIKLAHVPEDPALRAAQAQDMSIALTAAASRGSLVLDVANSVWAPPGSTLVPAFVQQAQENFAAMAQVLPGDDLVKSAGTVNAWVSQRTRGRISNIAGPAMFGPRTVALVNTVYLKARWASTFDPRKTKPRDFTLPKGSTLKLPMMSQSGAFNYADNESWQCVELPLQGGEATMLFLLPRDAAAMTKVETRLSSDTWWAVVGALEDCDVNMQLPRFSFSSELSMTSMWQFLGARLVFEEGKADLSGLVQGGPYFVKEVVHQAMIEVNELGAEAAAATVAAADPFGSPVAKPPRRQVTFIANRPFLWIITHRSSGLILFMGRFAGQ